MVQENGKITSVEPVHIAKLRRTKLPKWPGAGILIVPFKSTGFDATIRLFGC